MTKGILGKKVGMTQIFTEAGEFIPVTVIEATPNVVLQVKTVETDGYEAVQVGFDDKREVLSNKPAKGHVAKANTAPKRFIREFKNIEGLEVGSEITVDTFEAGDVVDVTGTSKGKGFQGVIKRHVLGSPSRSDRLMAGTSSGFFILNMRRGGQEPIDKRAVQYDLRPCIVENDLQAIQPVGMLMETIVSPLVTNLHEQDQESRESHR